MLAQTRQRFADMFKQVRHDAGKSQDYLSKELGISKKTLQNWESGLSSPPFGGLEIFQKLGMSPVPYYLKMLYPSLGKVSSKNSAAEIDEALIRCTKNLTASQKEKLLFLFLGDHGSSPAGIIELMIGHLQMPLRDRISIANTVISCYDLADTLEELSCPDDVQPDLDVLKTSLLHSVMAVKKHEKSYSILRKE